MIGRIKNIMIFILFVFFISCFAAGSVSADNQKPTKEFTLFYTGNTLGFLDPCKA
jgi:hypothetical protein